MTDPSPHGPAAPEPESPPGDLDPPRPLPPATWAERLAALGDVLGVDLTPLRLAVAVVVVVGAGVAGYLALRSEPAPPPEETLPFAEEASEAGEPTTTAPSAPPGELVVHAAGAVAQPGLYHVPGSARIADVIAAAGGATAEADLDRVNLAAPVADGQQVYVPRVGEALPAPVEPPGGEGGADGGGEVAGPVNLNTAGVTELDTLPGVGPATAEAIIAYRDEHGPFASVEELLEVPGIGEARLDRIRDLVTV